MHTGINIQQPFCAVHENKEWNCLSSTWERLPPPRCTPLMVYLTPYCPAHSTSPLLMIFFHFPLPVYVFWAHAAAVLINGSTGTICRETAALLRHLWRRCVSVVEGTWKEHVKNTAHDASWLPLNPRVGALLPALGTLATRLTTMNFTQRAGFWFIWHLSGCWIWVLI